MARVSENTKARAFALYFDRGWSQAEIAKKLEVTPKWLSEYISSVNPDVIAEVVSEFPAPISLEDLSEPARRGLEDFGYFRRRYFGRVAQPWAELAGHTVLEFIERPGRDYVVINAPPGSGKTTLFSHDLCAWLTVRRRTLRGLIGSSAVSLAANYTGRLRKTLSAKSPMQNSIDDVERGYAFDAVATLAADYGRFKPKGDDPWQRGMFTVEQLDGVRADEKESTWRAFGPNAEHLGWRVDFIVWDDLVTSSVVRSATETTKQRDWYQNEAETRLEPDGVMLLCGQRLGPEDLYRFCLDRTFEVEVRPDEFVTRPYYEHIVFPAHYDERCGGDRAHHRDTARPAAEFDSNQLPTNGMCLLDPVRLNFRELNRIRSSDPGRFHTVYQQRDANPASVLVPQYYIDGGNDPTEPTEVLPGCWDPDRDLCQLPPGLSGPFTSVCSVDPSPTKNWAVQWWVHHPESELRYLMDVFTGPMEAPDLLEWDQSKFAFRGLMAQWQQRSIDVGVPIRTWIVEQNAAQRFMLQYEFVRRWARESAVRIIGHDTHRNNRSDADRGVWSIRTAYRLGLVRLPGTLGARQHIHTLVEELSRFDGITSTRDDQVMANWMFEYCLPNLAPASRNADDESRRLATPLVGAGAPASVSQLASAIGAPV